MALSVIEKMGGLDILINAAGKSKTHCNPYRFDFRRRYFEHFPLGLRLPDGYKFALRIPHDSDFPQVFRNV